MPDVINSHPPCRKAPGASNVVDALRSSGFARQSFGLARKGSGLALGGAVSLVRAGSFCARRLSRTAVQRGRWAARQIPLDASATLTARAVHWLQQYSVPLLLGIAVALPWATLDPVGYEWWFGMDNDKPHCMPFGEVFLFSHEITLHFLVNDVFMAFFFGLAMKEVTESVLPGGGLNPPRKALSSLIGTVGGVLGPVRVEGV